MTKRALLIPVTIGSIVAIGVTTAAATPQRHQPARKTPGQQQVKRAVETARRPAKAVKSAFAPGTIVVGDASSILVFAPGAHGNVGPIHTISGSKTGLSEVNAVAVDPAGDVWEASGPGEDVEEFAAGKYGNVAPIRTIPADPPAVQTPEGLALTANGKHVWVGNDNSAQLTEFDATATGSNTPQAEIAGANTGMTSTHDIAISPDGSAIWQADGGSVSIHEYNATSGVINQTPIRTLVDGTSDNNYPEGVAVDVLGNVWVSDDDTGSVYEYTGANDTTPARTIDGGKTGFHELDYLALDPNGNVWVANEREVPAQSGALDEFRPTQNGNVAPYRVIRGSKTLLGVPSDVDVVGTKPSTPRKVSAKPGKKLVNVTWKAPKHNGGGLVGYVVERASSKHGKLQVVAIATKPAYVDNRVKAGHHYRYAVEALNELGTSHATKPVEASPKH